ncbi:MAG: hydrolase [Bacillales bacterium]|jgi:hypothetical protein|nr:hydrolase [Bacillales bacterium]
MCILKRNFNIQGEKCITYIPEKPNGFGLMIIGDKTNYITSNSWFWEDSPGRYNILSRLLDDGYTVFSVNLSGNHWGNNSVSNLIIKLYNHVLKNEILNPSIHLLTEGNGALLINSLLKEISKFRSISCIDPLFSIKDCILLEENQRIYYKTSLKEICEAYKLKENEIFSFLLRNELVETINYPVRIYTSAKLTVYQKYKNSLIMNFCDKYIQDYSIKYYMDDTKYSQILNITSFLKRYEKI